MSQWLAKAQESRAGRVLTFPVRASQRSYVTFLNKLRVDSFDEMTAALARNGTSEQAESDAAANFINIATGRGKLGAMENGAAALNTAFFAPRYVVSRFQFIAGQPLYRGTAATRKLVAKEYGRYMVGLGVVYGLAKLAGGDVEYDPRSSDFGKIRFGNTRLDPLSGLSQVITVTSKVASGTRKTGSGKVVPVRGEKIPFPGTDTADVIGSFARTKLAPMFSIPLDVISGQNVVGEPVTVGSTLKSAVVPLAMRDIYEAMVDQGVPRGTAIGLLSLLGMGLQTYQERRPKQKSTEKK